MSNFYILTNNPAVTTAYRLVTRQIDGSVAKVFAAVRDAVHLGAVLISHPLAGSLKPNECPYKSIVLSTARGPADLISLANIEAAIAVLQKLPVKPQRYGPPVLKDFQVIDLDLIRSAMQALPAAYHQHSNQNKEVFQPNAL